MAKKMIIEKSVDINKPITTVYDFIKISRNQDKFSVWNMADPNQKVTTSGTDGTVGYQYSWDSTNKNVGAGKQTITKLMPNEEIAYLLQFERPMKNTATSKFLTKELGPDKTRVTWTFEGETKFPMSLFSFIFKGMLGKDLQKGLDNLKGLLEGSNSSW
ncbi:MAG: SRPBCC family protein [Saprospiraceae bacterium]|nr:SRPBCC family protein [Saprospiraceae bacterium]